MHQLITVPLLLLLLLQGSVQLRHLEVEASNDGPSPCQAPLLWEGRWVVYDHGTGRNNRAAVSYDGQSHRLRVLQQHKKHTPCQRCNERTHTHTPHAQ